MKRTSYVITVLVLLPGWATLFWYSNPDDNQVQVREAAALELVGLACVAGAAAAFLFAKSDAGFRMGPYGKRLVHFGSAGCAALALVLLAYAAGPALA